MYSTVCIQYHDSFKRLSTVLRISQLVFSLSVMLGVKKLMVVATT